MRQFGTVVLAAVFLVPAVPAADDVGASAAPGSGRVCFQSYPMTFEQIIERSYKRAFAVFSGKVSAMTVETARITVARVWKGTLGAEVTMPTGTRDNRDGTYTVTSEAFSFRTGEEYLIFGNGTSAETLSTDDCEPNVRLAAAQRTIAVLDQIAARAGGSTTETRR